MRKPCVYILRCADNKLYVGATTNLTQRLHQHESGAVEGFTASRLPVELAFSMDFPTVYEAAATERKLKRWSHGKKEALIHGDEEALKQLAMCKNSTSHLLR
jgi:predicted GIY-YIG superfamily endonuclease